jgi:hypothetical protein
MSVAVGRHRRQSSIKGVGKMAFDDLRPVAKDYITQLAGNVANGTHESKIIRVAGSVNDTRDRIIQKSTAGGEDHVIFFDSYASGDAFQTLIVKAYIKGQWVDPNTWEGDVLEHAVEEYKKQ